MFARVDQPTFKDRLPRYNKGAHMPKAPSFKGFTSSSDLQSRTKRANRGRNTKPEIALRRALHRLGLRFRLKTEHLPGRPDLIFPSAKAAVFCDGDFWHGRDWRMLRCRLRSRANADYWLAKIEYNRSRDSRVNDELTRLGWSVFRLWEGEILSDPHAAAMKVRNFVESTRNASHSRVE